MDYLKKRWKISDGNDYDMARVVTNEGEPWHILEIQPELPDDDNGRKTAQHICDLHNAKLDQNYEDGQEYECFLSYKYSRLFSSGTGNCSIKMTGKISCIDHIRAIEELS